MEERIAYEKRVKGREKSTAMLLYGFLWQIEYNRDQKEKGMTSTSGNEIQEGSEGEQKWSNSRW